MTHRKTSRAFTIAELLISLTLMVVLMTAIAVATQGTLSAYEHNNRTSELTQLARAIQQRMTREIRTAVAVDCATNTLIIAPAEGPDEVRYFLDDSNNFVYRTYYGATQNDYVLVAADGDVTVQDFVVTVTTVSDVPVLATIRLDLASGDQTYSVTCSAAPRRNQSY